MIERLKFRGKVIKPIELGSIFTGGNEVPIGEWIVAPSDGWNLGVFFTYVTLGNIAPSTVGQWTGRQDKHDHDLFDGDCVRIFVEDILGSENGTCAEGWIEFKDNEFWITLETGKGFRIDILDNEDFEIERTGGTIHDKEQA